MAAGSKEDRTCIQSEAGGEIEAKVVPEAGHRTLLQEIGGLLLKLAAIALGFLLLFTFLFGAMRYNAADMYPAVKEGDLVMYYRLDKNYAAADLLVLIYEGKSMVGRVVAVEGDTVDITEDGLLVNGALQEERGIVSETVPYQEGIRFPVILEEGQVFVLGDSREHATDSRIYGPVKAKDTQGKVMCVIRRRNF